MSNFIQDISALNGVDLGEIDMPTEAEPYANLQPRTGGRTPEPGRFTLELPMEIKVGAWPANEKGPGSFELQFDTINVVAREDEPLQGTDIRYFSVSTRRIGGDNASSATDLLQRAQISPLPRNAGEWQAVAEQLKGLTVYGVYCDWEARVPTDFDVDDVREFLKGVPGVKLTNVRAGKTIIRGARNFPKGPDGKLTSKSVFKEGPGGREMVIYANLRPTLRGFALTEEERANQ